MRIAHVTGTVTATVKDPGLAGRKLLVVDIQDGYGNPIDPSVVAIDTIGAGVGDRVLLVQGSAARIPAGVSNNAVDATIIAFIDAIVMVPAQ